MLRLAIRLSLLLPTGFGAACASAEQESRPASQPVIAWQAWDDAVFPRAREQGRLVLLDLGAVWCHWCHVMDASTYADPEVARLLASGFVAVRADQDQRPDLATRYQDYGWPATILFDSRGRELAKLRGYIPPRRMAGLLAAFVADPTPGPSVTGAPAGSRPAVPLGAIEDALGQKFRDGYDQEQGGWGFVHKFLDADNVEWALRAAARGEAPAEAMARATLRGELRLLDPAFGGCYQYSHGGTWDNPHFEKILPRQAADLRAYALAFAQWQEPEIYRAAQEVWRFLREWLTAPEGAFWTSMDADLRPGEHAEDYFRLDAAARRARGVPRIDQSLHARDNGVVIEALSSYAARCGDASALAAAVRAAEWIFSKRLRQDGLMRHGADTTVVPVFGDTLAMGAAALELYATTADRAWLARSAALAKAAWAAFGPAAGEPGPGFLSARAQGPLPAVRDVDENVAAARWLLRLAQSTGDQAFRPMAQHALAFALAPETVAERRTLTGGMLLAHDEARTEPLHITVVGSKDDARAQALFAAAQALPGSYRRIDWLDAREGPLPGNEVSFPPLERPAAFVCGDGTRSPPIEEVKDMGAAVGRASK